MIIDNEEEFYEDKDIPFEEEEYSFKTLRETQINIPSLAEAKADIEEWTEKFQILSFEFYNYCVSQTGKLPLNISNLIIDIQDQFMFLKSENYLLKQMLEELAPKFFDPWTQREYALFIEADQLHSKKYRIDKKYQLLDALKECVEKHKNDTNFEILLKISHIDEIYQDYLRWRSKNKKDRANTTS